MKKSTTIIYEQERLLLHCQEAIASAIERGGMKRSEVAAELGKHKSFITQALSSGRNLTISSLASLLWAAGFRLDPVLAPIAQDEGAGKPEMHKLQLVPCSGSYEAASDAQNDSSFERGASVFEAAG